MVRASIPRCPSCENVIPLKKLGGGRTKCKQRS
nr:MAG TPA: PhnA Zinc-Ribbon [Caudoviricetes sp.]DAZ25947.1 MAG TPA: PhnA Zinc-Ribbon [Caudoviricetes sp.]